MKFLTLFLTLALAALFRENDAEFIQRVAILGVVINQASLTAALTGFKTIFQQAYDGAASALDKLAVIVPSSSRQEEYKWLGQFHGLREWIGERVVKDLTVEGYTIKNRDFEATVSVDRNDMEDDAIALYAPLFRQLGESARQHPDELIFDLLLQGFTQNCYDGKTLYATDHPNGDQGSWSNSGTAVLSQSAYESARSQMMSLVNEEGRPLRITPDILIVPPDLEATARTILRADKQANGATNIWKESADILVVPELAANPTYWFLTDTKKAAKPFIFQTRKEPEFVGLDGINDENVFMNKEYIYGVDYRGNAGYGLPHLIYGSTGGA